MKRGKSGAYRVFYLNAMDRGYLFLFVIISKSEEANLSRADVNLLGAEVAALKRRLNP